MKLKFKVSGDGIKAVAMQHGEKLAFALGLLVLVLFVWSAAGTSVLGPDKQPDKLAESSTKTDQHILNSKWDAKIKGIEVIDYVSRAKRDPLNDKDYRLAVFLNKPLWESKVKRPDPRILAVEELYATAGSGIFALAPDELAENRGNPAVGPGPRGPGMAGGLGGPGGPGGKPADPTAKKVPRPSRMSPPRRSAASPIASSRSRKVPG